MDHQGSTEVSDTRSPPSTGTKAILLTFHAPHALVRVGIMSQDHACTHIHTTSHCRKRLRATVGLTFLILTLLSHALLTCIFHMWRVLTGELFEWKA